MIRFGARPGLQRIAAVDAAGEPLERLLGGLQFACGDDEQPLERNREALLELQLLLEPLAPEAKRGACARRDIGFEIVDVGTDRLRRFRLRIGKVA